MTGSERIGRILRAPVAAFRRWSARAPSKSYPHADALRAIGNALNALVAGSDNQARILNDRLKELVAGSDNQARILNDRLKELVAGSDNQARILNDRLTELVAGSDNLARLLNEKLSALIAQSDSSMPASSSTDPSLDLFANDWLLPPSASRQTERLLTALVPTHNRPVECAAQLRFLRESGFRHRVIVLDSSDPDHAAVVRTACADFAEYRSFASHLRMADKLAAATGTVDTPYIVLIPDDDITLPHAIERALAVLERHSDYIAAHGYFLGFGLRNNDLVFDRVIGFTPSITADNPLLRHYELFRRYQSFYWGVFRTKVFADAVTAAQAMNVVLFRELTVMSTSILQGKVARLPMIYALRGETTSVAPIHNSNPLVFFLRDSESFVREYVGYRSALAKFMRERGIVGSSDPKLEQLLDVVHMTWLGREIDLGTVNYTARQLLGAVDTPVQPQPAGSCWGLSTGDDLVHVSKGLNRRYVWRRSVLEAEPRAEIRISGEEMDLVERQLDAYRLDRTVAS
jgi:glycosyltransferase domain-containing protein